MIAKVFPHIIHKNILYEKFLIIRRKIAAETLPNPSAQHQTQVAQRLVVGLHGLLITIYVVSILCFDE